MNYDNLKQTHTWITEVPERWEEVEKILEEIVAKSFPHLITTIKPREPCYVGPPKMDRSWWRIPTICGPLEKEIGKPLQYSCPENPMNNMQRQKDMTTEDEPPGQ